MQRFLNNISTAEFDGLPLTDAMKKEMLISGIEKAREALNNDNPKLRNTDGGDVASWEAVFQEAIDDELAELARIRDSS